MAICVEEPIPPCDETYWRDDNAAPPILLIDEATQVITESLHRFHSIPLLDYRDLAAAGVTLGDLFGALNLLTDLLGIPIRQRADTDALEARKLDDELQTLGALMRLAQQAAEGLWLEARKSFPPATQTVWVPNWSSCGCRTGPAVTCDVIR